jgi:hypothetical protein
MTPNCFRVEKMTAKLILAVGQHRNVLSEARFDFGIAIHVEFPHIEIEVAAKKFQSLAHVVTQVTALQSIKCQQPALREHD